MKLQHQPNSWSCLPSAFAIVLDRKVQDVVEAVGHDGSNIVFQDLPDPQRRRSFHIQEVLIACLKLGHVFLPIYQQLTITPNGLQKFSWICQEYDEFVSTHIGVFTGLTSGGRRHAVAWDGQEVYDPVGVRYNLSGFYPNTFYPLLS